MKLTVVQKSWEDGRLKWNPAEYEDITEITLPVNKLWVCFQQLSTIEVFKLDFLYYTCLSFKQTPDIVLQVN